MSASNNNPAGNSNGSGNSTTYPQLSKDGAQIVYSWLPHSTALGASSTVALRVRNASLSGAMGLVGSGTVYDNGTSAPASASSHSPSPEGERKHDDAESSNGSNGNDVECRVEASLYGFGLPLQAVPISTRYSSLVPYDDGGDDRSHHPDFACGKEWATATFDASISLPVRWRDLTRDACLALNVTCDGCRSDREDGGRNVRPSGDGGDADGSDGASRVWGATLPLFDRRGRLRAGLHKLELHPDMAADGGMGYRSKRGGAPVETFLEGGATPGVPTGDGRSDDGEEDPKWKASLVLHELDRVGSSGASPGGGSNAPGGAPASLPPQPANPRSVPWLDALTRERCLDVLHEREGGGPSGGPARPAHGTPAPTSSRRDGPYLIVELPTPPIPILHEEPTYPAGTSTRLRGTTGSITADELTKFHMRSRPGEAKRGDVVDGWDGLAVRMRPPATSDAPAWPPSSPSSPQSFLYPLVQTLDHAPPLADEDEDPRDNPAQDKYRALAHDLIRGLVDPGLKPDRVQRGRLERIVGSPSYHLGTEEKDLLWRFRFSLVDNRRALTKFLLAVDWTVESEVVQAAELLEQWRKRSPIEVTDALKLLGRNVAFQTSLVRSYAIETLSGAPDEELRLYLLQLVQALKYEGDIGGGVSGGNEAADAFPRSEGGDSKSTRASSLSAFLIERASRSIELANFLFWYLRVEMLNPIYEARYREVFMGLQGRLGAVRVDGGSIVPPGRAPESSVSLWELLTRQERFITGIMDCQRDSLLVRGKKDAKEGRLREALEAGGFSDIPHAVPLPSAPHIWVKGVNCRSAKMFKSALYPAVLDFVLDPTGSKVDGGGGGPVPGKKSTERPQEDEMTTCKVMIKTGDDLRQDQLVIMMIQLMDRLLKRGTLDLCLRPYSILAMPDNTGLMEFVEGSIPVSQILSGNGNSIMAFFRGAAPQEGARHSVKPDVLQTYIRSCAGYCVLTYLLGVGDRHLDNIMIQPSGHFFHIDFGFIFGRDPKPLPPAFRLTKEMVDGMGGPDSKEYRQFRSLACQAFNVLRKSAGLVLNLLHLMSDAGIEDLSHNPSADAIGVISKVEERFRLELTDERAESFFVGLIDESVAALAPRVMEMFHQLSVARR